MKWVARRIADGSVLAVIKGWLEAPVMGWNGSSEESSGVRKLGIATGERPRVRCLHFLQSC